MDYSNSRIFKAEEFISSEDDFLRLDNPRPFGLSGHLRVRNEALTLRACLDSCLPFLDELIVTYNDSDDNTEEILLEYAANYPHKIRLYWYPLEWGMCRGKMQLRPLGHLAQFCNFGYVKAKYQYYMKIDGDQVYFTDKMLFIKQMLHKYTTNTPIKISEFDTSEANAFYEKTIAKACARTQDYSFVLGGLEVWYNKNNDELCVYTTQNLDEKSLFNGFSGDTFIICPSSKQRYTMQGDYYETFSLADTKLLSLGLVWVHLGFVKQRKHFENSSVIPLQMAHSLSWDDVYERVNVKPTQNKKVHNLYRNLGRQFWDRDVPTYLTKEFYEQYFVDMLVLIRKYF